MSRLVMLSDATGVRAYARVMPDRIPAQQHQSGYGACKDARERANTVQTRHLDALWRITTAGLLVAKEYELHRQRLGTDGTDLVFPSRRTRGRGRSRPAMRNDLQGPGAHRAAQTSPGRAARRSGREGGAAESVQGLHADSVVGLDRAASLGGITGAGFL